jgi:glyoxylase I family protein
MSVKIKRIHHVGYRCRDAKRTVAFYRDILGMKFITAVAEDIVPTTKEHCPYFHLFLDAGMGNVLAFFELPEAAPMRELKPDGPMWAQHFAMEVESIDDLLRAKARLEDAGVKVIGPTDHSIFTSIYFHDPDGHRMEFAVNSDDNAEKMQRLEDVADDMLEEWSKTKRAPRHADWIHQEEFSAAASVRKK